jgi:two-component system OmpR family response regulator
MRILVVEDEPALAFRLQRVLEEAGFAVDVAYDGDEAVRLGMEVAYDAAVLDLGLPRLDGLGVLRRWRDEGRTIPVLVATARGRWSEKMAGFNAGADDYVVKPFELDEIAWRLRALIRRSCGHSSPELVCGPLVMDDNSGRVSLEGRTIRLSPQESRILSYLLHHQGRAISRERLANHAYDRHFDADLNVIDVLVGRIRRKIGSELIETVRGRGFMMGGSSG